MLTRWVTSKRSSGSSYNYGFTIVELLIVIVVIGILAAISIVAYNGIQNKANNNIIHSDLSSMAKQVSAFHAIHSRYPSPTEFLNGTTDLKISASKSSYNTTSYNLYYCRDRNTQAQFGIAARSKSGQTYTISSTSSITPVAAPPSWTSSCGAFGGTVLADIEFGYGYDFSVTQWRSGV